MATANQSKLDSGIFDQSPEWKFLFEQELTSVLEPNQSNLETTASVAQVHVDVPALETTTSRGRDWISAMIEGKLVQCYAGAIGAYALAIVLGIDLGFATAFLGGSTAMFLSASIAQNN